MSNRNGSNASGMVWSVVRGVAAGKTIGRAMMNHQLAGMQLSGRVVVDLGGGADPSYRRLLDKDVAILRMDILPETRPHFVGDLERGIPLAQASVDTALLLNTLEHIYDFRGVLAEVHRILRPGGKVIVYVPFLVGFHTHQGESFFVNDYFRYTQSALVRVSTEVGFADAAVDPVGGVFWAAASFLNTGFRLRPLQVGITALCGALERVTMRFRSYDTSEKFALGYFLSAVK